MIPPLASQAVRDVNRQGLTRMALRQPLAAGLARMDDDVGIEQHGRSISKRKRAVPADFSLPSRRIGNVPVRVQPAHGCQSLLPPCNHLRRRLRFEACMRCDAVRIVVNHQQHPRRPGPYPSGQGLGDCYSPVRSNLGFGCQRRHDKSLPHPTGMGNANSSECRAGKCLRLRRRLERLLSDKGQTR